MGRTWRIIALTPLGGAQWEATGTSWGHGKSDLVQGKIKKLRVVKHWKRLSEAVGCLSLEMLKT